MLARRKTTKTSGRSPRKKSEGDSVGTKRWPFGKKGKSFSLEAGNLTDNDLTTDSMCSMQLPAAGGMPSCANFQAQCCDAAIGAQVGGTLATAASAATQILTGTGAGTVAACMGFVPGSIAIQVNDTIEGLEACDTNPDACPSDIMNMVQQSAEVFCALSSCLPTTGPQTAAIAAACVVGQIGAQIITCTNYDDFCRQELINAQPVDDTICCNCTKTVMQDGIFYDTQVSPPEDYGTVTGGGPECSAKNNTRVDDAANPGQYSYFTSCSVETKPPGEACWVDPTPSPTPSPSPTPTATPSVEPTPEDTPTSGPSPEVSNTTEPTPTSSNTTEPEPLDNDNDSDE